jgi:Flp pilus assembly protein TadD
MQKLGSVPGLLLKILELELAAKKFEAALARVQTMERVSPRPEPWMKKRAEILIQAGRREEARKALQELQHHIATLTDPAGYLGMAGTFVDRVLARV